MSMTCLPVEVRGHLGGVCSLLVPRRSQEQNSDSAAGAFAHLVISVFVLSCLNYIYLLISLLKSPLCPLGVVVINLCCQRDQI